MTRTQALRMAKANKERKEREQDRRYREAFSHGWMERFLPDAAVGTTLRIKLPNDYTVRGVDHPQSQS